MLFLCDPAGLAARTQQATVVPGDRDADSDEDSYDDSVDVGAEDESRFLILRCVGPGWRSRNLISSLLLHSEILCVPLDHTIKT